MLGHSEVIQRITHDSPKACPVFSMDRFRTMVKEREYSGADDSTGMNWGTEMADDDEKDTPERTYTVRSGDTLWGIANREGTTIADLRRLNPTISGDLIRPGDVLRL